MGFALAAALGINLVVATIIAMMFAFMNYQIKTSQSVKVSTVSSLEDEEEEDI